MSTVVNAAIGILSLIIGIIGAIFTYRAYSRERKLKTVSWSDIQNGTKFIWKELRKKEFIPDLMISPDPKGGIIAFLLGQFFDQSIYIDIGHAIRKDMIQEGQYSEEIYTIINTNRWKVVFSKQLENISSKENIKVLIVEDFVLSGDFNLTLFDFLTGLGYKKENIMVSCLAVTKVAISSSKEPDLCWKIVDNEDFYFPWGKAE